MNEALALACGPNVASTGVDDLQALLGLPSKRRPADELPNYAVEALRGVKQFIDSLLLQAITARSTSEFKTIRDKVWLPYAKTVVSMSKLAHFLVPPSVMDTVLGESFSELEAEFREHGSERFGPDAKDQAIFTVFTLRRTSRLISKIAALGSIPEDLKDKNQDLLVQFTFFGAWTQFHLDCLLLAIRRDQEISFDIMPAIIDGLRAAVNAYGLASEALDLRPREQEFDFQSPEWDQEDQVLLDASMRDMASEFPELIWDESEAARRSKEVTKSPTFNARHHRRTAVFGTHIREGVDIIRDWIEHPKPKQ